MRFTFLLLPIIYIAFVSLGLPDALLGAAWPDLHRELAVSVSFAGIITFIISCGTVISSLLSNFMNQKFGTGKLTAFSVFMTAVALFGFSISGNFWMLCLWAIPYGLGAGGVDAALNNYVAIHYSSRHMNWLHGFWGVGVAICPYIMSTCLLNGLGWQSGYRFVAVLQMVLSAAVFISLPLWNKNDKKETNSDEVSAQGSERKHVTLKDAVRLPGVAANLAGFFCYCAMEASSFVWTCSYLVFYCGIDPAVAARWSGLLFIGMMIGRFSSGVISNRMGDRNMVRLGLCLIVAGISGFFLPWTWTVLTGLLLLGLGYAPIYPAFIHETPACFGRENSQAIVGIQMASAYIGATFFPPVFGFLAQWLGFWIFPYFVLFFTILTLLFSEKANRIIDRRILS